MSVIVRTVLVALVGISIVEVSHLIARKQDVEEECQVNR